MLPIKHTVCALALSAVAAVVDAAPASAGSLCVGNGAGCFATIQAAVDSANAGDVIHIGPGTFAGGVTVEKALRLVGAGAGVTLIRGGGPVLTIGQAGASSEPTVTIERVTIADGVNDGSPALGGGIYVPTGSGLGDGATVTLANSVVTGNRAAPAVSGTGCGGLPAAQASGGGIDNGGTMRLVNVVVTGNVAGSAATSDADGGGIMNEFGATVSIRNSQVDDNVARVTPPVGRFAAGGGIFTRKGSTLAIASTRVNGNTVDYSTSVPSGDCSGFAQAGGIKIGGDETTTATVRDSAISDNAVLAQSSNGDTVAFAGGIDADGSLVLQNSAVTANRVTATGPEGVFLDGGGLELEGPVAIRNVDVSANTLEATTASGLASAEGAGVLAGTDSATISNSLIAANSATSTASSGTAVAQGGGLANVGQTTVRRTLVTGNNVHATGGNGVAQGGGVWNGTFGGPPPTLSLLDSAILHNSASGSPGIAVAGGGVYSDFPLTVLNTVIAGNTPDQCVGC